MIKVGDYVRIKEEFKDKYFYSDELYKVVGIDDRDSTLADAGGLVLQLDRPYPPDKDKQYNGILMDNVYVDIKYMRSQKLKQIFND